MELDERAEDMISELKIIILNWHASTENRDCSITGCVQFLETKNQAYGRLSEPTKYLYFKMAIYALSEELDSLHEMYKRMARYMYYENAEDYEDEEDYENDLYYLHENAHRDEDIPEDDRMLETDIDIFEESDDQSSS